MAEEPKLRWWVIPAGVLLVIVGVIVVLSLPTLLGHLPLPTISLPKTDLVTPQVTNLPESFKPQVGRYGKELPKEKEKEKEPPQIPVAEQVRHTPPPVSQNFLQDYNPFAKSGQGQAPKEDPGQAQAAAQAAAAAAAAQAAQVAKDKEKKGWDFLAKGKKPEPVKADTTRDIPKAGEGGGVDLIHNARWQIPVVPLKTLYRSMLLPGRTLDAINSDVPGMVRIILTVPVFDKFNYDQEILAKGSIIIASTQGGQVRYGTSRLEVKLEQIELPSGEVIALKATVGDKDGAQGMNGKVNNHYGKLVLATGLSALLNIGVRAAAGTPGGGQYYQNPLQSAAQDVGQSVQRDAQSVVDRELKVPPTITVAPGTMCTVGLLENVQFAHPAQVVK